jgi:hypothetical protein
MVGWKKQNLKQNNMYKISQSFLKDFSDYKSDFETVCGLQIKAKFFDGVEFPSSEAMDLGNYFEYKATGCLPRNGRVPEPRISYKGKKNECVSAPFQRANESAEFYKKIIKEYGIEVLDVGTKLSNDKMNGIADIYAKWNGRYCFIDLKYSGLIDNRWDERGWETNSLSEKHKLMIQGVQYTILAKDCLKHEYKDFDFYYFIFSQQDPNYVKIIHQVIDVDTLDIHKKNVDFVYNQINSYPLDRIFKPKPTLKSCSKCPLFDDCDYSTSIPLIEKVYY